MRTLPLEIANGLSRRNLRVIAGQNMVEPTQRLVVQHEDGRTEELIPGRDRLIRDYPWVRKHPELFTPCDPKDFSTYRHHRRLLERTRHQVEREMARTTTRTAAPKRFRAARPSARAVSVAMTTFVPGEATRPGSSGI